MNDIENLESPDPDRFLKDVKRAVLAATDGFGAVDLYIVWFAKTLQNWKALVSTDKVDGWYWEVTYNGDKNEIYVGHYKKSHNTLVILEESK